MGTQSALVERDLMQLPDLPKGKCINHPTVKAVGKHLCVPCLDKWNKLIADYEALREDEANNDDTVWHGGNFKNDEDMGKK